jgi:hypothetical protein
MLLFTTKREAAIMHITNTQLDNLREALGDMSQPEFDFEVREDYSGRGMYNRECVGFVTDSPLELHGAICAVLAEANAEWDEDTDFYGIDWFLLKPRADSMGRSSILYYSNLQLVDD